MKTLRHMLRGGLAVVFAFGLSTASIMAHHAPSHAISLSATPLPAADNPTPGAVTGQGKMRFRVLVTSDRLPEEAKKVLVNAHGGFAVDRRAGKGEAYFSLPGAGIIQISADFKTIRTLPTADSMKNTNLHNSTIWYAPDGTPYLVFPGNEAGKVFTTTLDGKLVNTLNAPSADDDFGVSEVNDYFHGAGKFVPTDVEELEGLYYITTGYSSLDYVLTARIIPSNPFQAMWNDLVWGGKGEAHGQFKTGHGITIPPGTKRIDIADRPNSRIERFNRYGRYLSSLYMPTGSLPCDINYLDQYAIVAALDGPDTSRGAPIYIFENDHLISTVMPKEELGLQNFKHNHNATMVKSGGKYYILAEAWNPGDFAILEQVTE